MNRRCRIVLALWLAASPLSAHAQPSRADDLERLGDNLGVFKMGLRRKPTTPRPVQPAPPAPPTVRKPPPGPTPEQIRERLEAKLEYERTAAIRREQKAKLAREREERRKERLAALKLEGDPKSSKPSPVNLAADKPVPSEPTVAATASASPAPAANEFASLSREERGRRLGLLATQVADAAADEAP